MKYKFSNSRSPPSFQPKEVTDAATYTHFRRLWVIILFITLWIILTTHCPVNSGQKFIEQELLGLSWWYSTEMNKQLTILSPAKPLTTKTFHTICVLQLKANFRRTDWGKTRPSLFLHSNYLNEKLWIYYYQHQCIKDWVHSIQRVMPGRNIKIQLRAWGQTW